MDDLSITSPVRRVVFMKPTRIGGSECGINWMGYIIDVAPGPFMLVLPTEGAGKKYVRQKIDPMIARTPKVLEHFAGTGRSTTFEKVFEGGQINIANARSAPSLRAIDARYLKCDEVDAYEADVDNEGDPLELALKRTANFGARAKQYLVSSPKLTGLSRIKAYYKMGDQRRYFVPCPHCEIYQVLKFKNLRWPQGEPEKAAYFCEGCDAEIEEKHKTEMLEKGEWRPTAQGDGITKSYTINGLYTPAGWTPGFADIAREFEAAKKDPTKLKVFVNTILAETWEERGEAPDHERVYERREDYPLGTAPEGVLFLTAGVDIQKDRIEADIWGWGRGDQCWLVDTLLYEGQTDRSDVWKLADKIFDLRIPHERGCELPIIRVAVDTSYLPGQVRSWSRDKPQVRLLPIVGRDGLQMAIGTPTLVDVDRSGKRIARGLRAWPVGSSFLKSDLYSRLRLKSPEDGEDHPDRWVHISTGVDSEFCQQLTAEDLVISKTKMGYPKRQWRKNRDRNEKLDCWCYARAAAVQFGIERFGEKHWRKLERALGIQPPPDQTEEKGAPKKPRRRRRKTNPYTGSSRPFLERK